ncbi:radical SAM family heme chaperone HemW [Desulforamulus ruminis]|uniref:Heme chaperone HemW n=1 Tax=Desulforamulus ruminis (strain ATCC 23193 / DSM 2154 / NCIMB 8452 / DL) TaxID=696281 RepID=F6DM66_DESRL|nr:radical SAM family heme chaperone HemW [Desulforamulus ruminis]AEG59408.1 oxygen-independent coproporphyrinogen III oxidase [Desulforamulus ruminis DSM 2154]
MPLGLYIHVPFCLRKCLYCDFTSYPYQQDLLEKYLEGLWLEMEYYRQELSPEHKQIATIFVGGGTPTCLVSGQLTEMLEQVGKRFQILPDAEITVEANPGTVSLTSLKELKAAGFNRLSLGIQSTHAELLKRLGRIHTVEQAKEAVDFAGKAGFNNINLDLIFGLPGQTVEQWQQSLSQVLALSPQHLSCYGLQLEEGTPLCRSVDKGELEACPEEWELTMYRTAIETLAAAGYRHYEISNFSRDGYRCRHNLNYWQNGQYLGFGPAAHSHLGGTRWGNTENIMNYVRLLQEGQRPILEIKKLSKGEQMEETAFLGLRLMEGLSLDAFKQRYGREFLEVFGQQVHDLQKKGLVQLEAGHLKLTSQGLPVANRVFAEFIQVVEEFSQ